MKLFISVLAFTFFTLYPITNTSTNSDLSSWYTEYDKAIKASKKSNKNILMYFSGSDWCGPCKSLKKDLFDTTEFQEISENYVLLYIDIPRNRDLISPKQYEHNKSMLGKFNQKGVFPLLHVVDQRGKSVAKKSGYSMTGEIQYHLDFLKKNQ